MQKQTLYEVWAIMRIYNKGSITIIIAYGTDKYKGVNPKNSNSWTGKHTLIVDFESHIITIYDDYVE